MSNDPGYTHMLDQFAAKMRAQANEYIASVGRVAAEQGRDQALVSYATVLHATLDPLALAALAAEALLRLSEDANPAAQRPATNPRAG